jgi:hypothetical protein
MGWDGWWVMVLVRSAIYLDSTLPRATYSTLMTLSAICTLLNTAHPD